LEEGFDLYRVRGEPEKGAGGVDAGAGLVAVEDFQEGLDGAGVGGLELAGGLEPDLGAGLVEGGEEDRVFEPALEGAHGDRAGVGGFAAGGAGDEGLDGEALVIREVEGLCGRGEGCRLHG
jgi:hypothetical protein